MKTIRILFSAVIFILSAISAGAQDVSLQVWPEEIPGAIENPDYIRDTVIFRGGLRIRKISHPSLEVYFPEKNDHKGAAVVICPGGAYWRLAVDIEGFEVASWLNSLGITACVLYYRLPSDDIMNDKSTGPLQDGLEAMRIVRRHAEEWNIDPDKIGIMGFSAGGHLASSVSTHFNDTVYPCKDNTSARPDFSILVYPVISMEEAFTHMGSRNNLLGSNPSPEKIHYFSNETQVNANTPPAFLVHAEDDVVVPLENSINYFLALKKYKIPGELHIYESGGHGFGLGMQEGTKSYWPEACGHWLKINGFF